MVGTEHLNCRKKYSHRSVPTALSGLAMLLLVTVLAANPAAARVVSGSYTGDGSTNRPITGLGFRPAVVIVKGDLPETGVIRTDIYLPGNSKQMCAPAMEITDGIMDFTADGFTVDQGVEVNSTGVVYHWVALSSDPGTLDTGWYWGDGASRRAPVFSPPVRQGVLPRPFLPRSLGRCILSLRGHVR